MSSSTQSSFAQQMAAILTEYSSPVQQGEYITIVGNESTCAPLLAALAEAVLKKGAYPNIQGSSFLGPDYSDYFELYMKYASDEMLEYTDTTMNHWIQHSDAAFFIKASANTKALSSTDPARIAKFRQGVKPISNGYLERYARGEMRWTVVGWVSPAMAQTAEMSLLDYTDFIKRACGLDQPDPVAYWQAFGAMQEKLITWLSGKKHAEIKGPGIDLSFDFADRPWVNCDGKLNFPDGEIFTSPVEDSVNGTVEFNYPCVYLGNEVSGVKLRFEDGVAVEASAERNEAFLLSQLDLDAGARTLGEFAIGTNNGVDVMTRSILFDEKIGGSIHMALGQSYAESNGQNKSAIHWDMVHSMKEGGQIIIDGELFYDSGEFKV
ncbi:MAG: aminopeptidase [Anaerolineae bacterium]|nr:aminopeptidase [Anaerolineae bacterium]